MKNLSLLTLLAILFVSCAPGPTPAPTKTAIPTISLSPTLTASPIPTLAPTETQTPRPTATLIPEVDLDSFVFPYDISQVVAVWQNLKIPAQHRYFTYHIVNRNSKNLPYENPCGYHPGDLIVPIGTTKPLDNFAIDVKLPYSGKLVDKWKTQGGDDGFTFLIGTNAGKKVYLNVYHTTKSNLSLGQFFMQGDIFGSLTYTTNFGGWNEAKVHLTLFNPDPSGNTDFLGDIHPFNVAPYALSSTMQAMFENNTKLLIIYEGENWCNMSSAEKNSVILNEYLPNAGFCVDGAKVTYCGKNDLFQGITFNQAQYDARSVMLTPANK